MNETKEIQRKTKQVVLALMSICLLIIASALSFAATGIVISDGTAQDLYFVGTSSNPAQRYQDAISPNPDVGLELCGQTGTSYVGGTYAFNVGGTWNYTLITYGTDPTDALALTSLRAGDCYITSPMGSLTVSPSSLSSRTPQVYVAAFPGTIFVMNSSSQDGSSPTFIAATASSLLGSYSVTRTFDESTQDITVQTPTISFTTESGSFTKSASDADYGVNDDRRMAVAVCTDTQGETCTDGRIVNDSSVFPLDLASGVTPNEALTFTRYVVINGLDYSICIGPDLNTNTLRIDGSASLTVYSGESVNISVITSNSQNVNVTSSFDIGINVSTTNPQNFTINSLGSGESTTNYFIYDTSSLSSGAHTVQSILFDSALGDCNDGNDGATATLTIAKTYRPYVWIDGIQTNNFTHAGRPYNITIQLNDSDGNIVSGARIEFIESNGLNLFAPTQIFTETGDGLKPVSSAVIFTNSTGEVSFSIIPTGNKLYEPAYASYNVSDHVGNYSLYFEVFDGNTTTELQLAIAGQGLVDQYDFNLLNMIVYSPNSSEKDTLRVVNQDEFFQQVLEFVDQAFAAAYGWLDII